MLVLNHYNVWVFFCFFRPADGFSLILYNFAACLIQLFPKTMGFPICCFWCRNLLIVTISRIWHFILFNLIKIKFIEFHFIFIDLLFETVSTVEQSLGIQIHLVWASAFLHHHWYRLRPVLVLVVKHHCEEDLFLAVRNKQSQEKK